MTLGKELLRFLDDKDEPLPKRLKIADNAFKSAELPLQHREALLLKWLVKQAKGGEAEMWSLLEDWLTSQQMQDLSRHDFSQEDVKGLIRLFLKRVKQSGSLDNGTLVKCVVALLQNRNFQLYFKHNLEAYCNFISSILCRIDSQEQICSLIKSEHLFSRNIISCEGFHRCFIEDSLMYLVGVVEKFSDIESVFQEISKLVERCLFQRNYKTFQSNFKMVFEENVSSNEKTSDTPRLLLESLKNSNSKYLYKLVFHAYCTSYGNDFAMIYRFFVLAVETLGWNLAKFFSRIKISEFENGTATLSSSIEKLTELCRVMMVTTNDLNYKINEITLSHVMRDLALSVILLSGQPHVGTYDLIGCMISVDPLVVEKIVGELLVFTMLSDKQETKLQYEACFISVVEVFEKLHRVPNLISKMIPILKDTFTGTFKPCRSNLSFAGDAGGEQSLPAGHAIEDVLPEPILNYFTKCIIVLPSWQVMNVFKTLLFHLDAIITKDLTNAVENKTLYIEVLSVLLCQFLSSVRIAEHTVPTAVVEKFVKSMEDLKGILSHFGTALVKMEHNPTLMRAYLNICYAWGDLYMSLAYYSMNGEVTIQKTSDSDLSACNITYLHPYLTRDQWCLIAQRIANFGEKPCKLIMHKMFIQKLKALLLFDRTVSEEVTLLVRNNVLSSIDDTWQDIVSSRLVVDQIVSKAPNLAHIAEIMLQDVVQTRDLRKLEPLLSSKELIRAILYVCLQKLNKAFRRKHKKAQITGRTPVSPKVFPFIAEDLFLSESQDVQQVIEVFGKEMVAEVGNVSEHVIIGVNERILSDYMDVIKAVPFVQCKSLSNQQVAIIFLVCVLWDLQHSALEDSGLVEKCEKIIVGIVQNCRGSLKFLMQNFAVTRVVVDSFSRYAQVFALILQDAFKGMNIMVLLRDSVDFFAKNSEQERYLHCATIIFDNLFKHRKCKAAIENKELLEEYLRRICDSVLTLIERDRRDFVKLTEPYAAVMKCYLVLEEGDRLTKLQSFLEDFVNEIVDNSKITVIKGAVSLFIILFRNKSQIKVLDDSIVMKAWNFCQNFNIDEEEREEYSKLVILIFEHIPNEQFFEITEDLLKSMDEVVSKDSIKDFKHHLNVWSAILSCSFNPVKKEIWQKTLESLLLKTIITFLQKGNSKNIYEDVAKFENAIIQNFHILLTPSLTEAVLTTVSVIFANQNKDFCGSFAACVSLLENLLKYRRAILMDYLPSFLQRYRVLLVHLCAKSNSEMQLEANEAQEVANCAHKLEKLTRNLVSCDRHVMRISPYLIADILKQYEEVTLLPNVKMHLNNCLYSLVSLCDQHAVSYLMRVLSTASTEMFKMVYMNYKKYYKFTGKV